MKYLTLIFIICSYFITPNIFGGNKYDKFTTHVTLTSYNPVKKQCDNTPLITANGTKINLNKLRQKKIKIAAISRDLLWIIPMDSIIYIEGHGYYVVADVMNKRYNHCIDILQHPSEKNFKKEKIKITKIR